jgi:hypothetical protein
MIEPTRQGPKNALSPLGRRTVPRLTQYLLNPACNDGSRRSPPPPLPAILKFESCQATLSSL